MKDIRIVIVSWNVQERLDACLKSLPTACKGLDWDCVVVDNNSSDGSVNLVKEYAAQDERLDIIVNSENRGFAAACDQGAARHEARYVLLLNPDTECPPGSLAALVAIADRHPDVGIMGPKLIYPDGRYQPNAQRFPTLWDQSLILLKLHHVFPGAASLRRYFFQDLDKDKAQAVDQVMGACFLVRSELWDKAHGLDQRYFIWFEEVDLCRQAIEQGWKVWYEPSVQVIHHEGQAFAKVFSLKRQRYFNDSLRKYMRKWHGPWAWALVTCLHPISLAMAAIVTPLKLRPGTRQSVAKAQDDLSCSKQLGFVWYWLAVILSMELVSALAQGRIWVQVAALGLIALAMILVTYRRPAIGLTAVALELVIGGMGHLLEMPADHLAKGISLRMVLMAAFFLVWAANALRHKVWRYWKLNELFILQVWVFVAGMVIGALVRGLQLGQQGIFNDLNAWLYLLYFIPVLDVAHRYGRDLARQVMSGISIGLIWMCLKMLLVFGILSHQTPVNDWLYAWIRDTRIGELTPMNGLYRVFFQSSVYAAIAYLTVLVWWLEKGFIRNLVGKAQGVACLWHKNLSWSLGLACAGALLVGLSRSFWIGTFVGAVVIAILALREHGKKFGQAFLGMSISGAAALAVIMALALFPWPQPKVQSLADFFAGRTQMGDAAANSRWALWPAMWDKIKLDPILGEGFGSTVTYRSQDPRVLAANPDGLYTTPEFEWGWLGLWIKFGIFGPIIMTWLLVSLVWRTWRSRYAWWLRAGVVGGTCALAVIHFFTPYLDHPLGFGWLLAVEGFLAVERESHELRSF